MTTKKPAKSAAVGKPGHRHVPQKLLDQARKAAGKPPAKKR
jgi:hypothetical protein